MKFYRILAAVDGGDADRDAVQLACKLAKETKGKVFVVHVIEVKRSLPLNAELNADAEQGQRILRRAQDCANERDCIIETDLLQAREPGPAIVSEIHEKQIDLLLMGMSYRTKFGHFDIGETIPYVLKNAPCRVMILRQPLETEPK
ncbi:MAG: universal stress protein [Dehalococcoidia bacterium]|nr:universal stress protein [Dehalococcoidia bacterium]